MRENGNPRGMRSNGCYKSSLGVSQSGGHPHNAGRWGEVSNDVGFPEHFHYKYLVFNFPSHFAITSIKEKVSVCC